DAVRRHHPRRHDVGDGDFFVRLPVAGVELFLVADDAIHFRHGGESRGFRLCGTAGDDDARGRPLTLDVTDALARLAHRFRRHRTGVHHNRVAQTSGARLAPDHFRLVGIQAAAECDDIDAHTAPASVRNNAELKRPSYSNCTGPVIST